MYMKATQRNYKELSNELDDILARLQSSEISVDEAVSAYESGMKIITQLETYLTEAELKIAKVQPQK